MTPKHHMPDDVLVEYAAGRTCESVSLVTATHLTLCPACRRSVATLESVGGELLATAAPVAPRDDMLAKLREIIGMDREGAEGPPREVAAAPRPELRVALPAPLQSYVARSSWRWLAPGMKQIRLVESASELARLIHLAPGVEIPHHDHAGPEFLLVLDGALTQEHLLFGPGDVACAEAGTRHTQRVPVETDCTALAVTWGSLLPLTLRGRILKLVTGG